MPEAPKVQMNFIAPVNSAVGNVQGDLYVNPPPKSLVELAKELQELLAKLNLNYKATSEPEQKTLVKKIIQAIQQFSNLRDMFLAGGIELIKIVCPPLGIPIEMGKKLPEAAENHTNK
jgi:hypothetical protein